MGDVVGVWILYFLTALTPGPSTLLIVHHSKLYPYARSAAIGVSLSTLFWVLIAITGYCTVINTNYIALFCLKIIGSIYFLILAVRLAKNFLTPAATSSLAPSNTKPVTQIHDSAMGVCEGLITGMANPNTALFFLTLMGPIICTAPSSLYKQVVCGAGICFISLFWYQLLAWGISSEKIQHHLKRADRYIQPLLSATCVVFAFRLWV